MSLVPCWLCVVVNDIERYTKKGKVFVDAVMCGVVLWSNAGTLSRICTITYNMYISRTGVDYTM